MSDLTQLFGAVRAALTNHLEAPENTACALDFLTARRRAASAIARLPRQAHTGPEVTAACELLAAIRDSGVLDAPTTPEDAALVQQVSAQGWPGLLAAMLLTSAWQWPHSPAFEAVPNWLWGDYAAWLFTAPQGFSAPSHAELYAVRMLSRLEELARWAERNPGSAAVRSAVAAYLRSSAIPLYFSTSSLRGRLLRSAVGPRRREEDMFPFPRDGRRLRIGFVNRHFGPQTETYTTIPSFEQLDPERFDVILFAHRSGDSPVETYARQCTREFHVLPSDLPSQLDQLRAANLDIVVYGTNVTAVCNEVTQLALYRVAPLQVINNSSCVSSGFPEIDLYVSGTLTETADAASHFSERLGLLPGPTHAFNYEVDRQEPTEVWTRARLGLPDDAIVFVSAANYFKIIPEMQHAWARLLAAVPGSYLLVHPFNPNWSSSYPIKRFCAEFDRVLQVHGVDSGRLVVSTNRFPSRTDVKELLGVGDIYLDTFPFGGVNSLIDPLELGLPTLVWEGHTMRARMGAALLRSLDLPELIVTGETDYVTMASRLATNAKLRVSLRERIKAAMESGPVFLDALAASDAFGDLMETAFDALVAQGRQAFRADRTPLRAAGAVDVNEMLDSGTMSLAMGAAVSAVEPARTILRGTPNHARARALLGRALVASGELNRGIHYLVAAVQQLTGDAELWYDAACALRQQGQTQNALQALESSLRLDAQRLDAWVMLAEMAQAIGSLELAREATGVARDLAPDDSRVAGLVAGLG